jgi:hypothetical protein
MEGCTLVGDMRFAAIVRKLLARIGDARKEGMTSTSTLASSASNATDLPMLPWSASVR